MRYTYPQNIILDLQQHTPSATHDYWTINYSLSFRENSFFFKSLALPLENSAPLLRSTLPNLKSSLIFVNSSKPLSLGINSSKKPSKRTLRFNVSGTEFLKTTNYTKYNHFLNNFRSDSLKKIPFGDSISTKSLKQTIAGNANSTSSPLNKLDNLTFTLFDINFIKKERLYTKLKYSRSPAYDIVSGGSAALLAGFIGFLVSEKFGIELVDSGDFYIVFMYIVFASFFCRPLLKIMSMNNTVWDIISLNFLIDYIYTIFLFCNRFFMVIVRKFLCVLNVLRAEHILIYTVLIFIGFLL